MNPITAIKVGIKVVSDPKLRKVIVYVVVGVICIFGLLPVIAMAGIATLVDQSEDQLINEDFDITQTELYQEYLPIYQEYIADIEEQMQAIADRIIAENTVTKTDPDTGETYSYCTVDVTISTRNIKMAYLLAYINASDYEVLSSNKYKIKKNEVFSFFNTISKIKIENAGDNYHIYNEILKLEAIAEKYFGEDEEAKQIFLISYENYIEFIDEFADGTGDDYLEDLEYAANGMNIPLYLQYDSKWGGNSYGTGTIQSSGCAPTALAMVLTYLTGSTLTPPDIVAWTGNRYYVNGAGSSWAIFDACAGNWGVNCTNIGKNSQAIVSALSSGKPVIASMGPGTFTRGGHFIVLRGVTEDGRILVNDPNDSAAKNHVGTEFPLSLIMSEAKNFWSFG